MFFYALGSMSQRVCHTPFIANSDSEAISILVKTIVSHADPALIYMLDDLTLYRIGSFVPERDQPLVAFEDVELVMLDLVSELPLPPMIKEQVDQIYGHKEVKNG